MSELPEGWVEMELGEVAKVQTGPFGSQLHNRDYVNVGTPMITVEHIVNDKIYHAPNIPKVSDKDKQRLSKYILKEGDIVFSRVGSVDRSAYVSNREDAWMFSGRLLRVRGNAKLIDSNYLHYVLIKKTTKKYIRKIAVGATMPSINTSILSEIPIITPSIPEQKAIAKLLSSFDEKIELLQEQNKTLETIAQTIFKEWFVNFNYSGATGEMVDSDLGEIPKEWRVGKLSEFGKIICGKTPPKSKKEFFGGGIPFIKIPDMHNQMFIITTSDTLTEQGKKFQELKTIPSNSILVSCIATVGLVGISIKESQTNQQINTIVPQQEYYREYLYLEMLRKNKYLNDIGNGGTATLNVNTGIFSSIEMLFPENDLLVEFSNLVKPIFGKILYNVSQIQTLAKTRDTLLPKLMSGEIRITY